MPLDEKERTLVRNALLVFGEERLRVEERIDELVKQAIRLRDVQHKLEIAYDDLRGLVYKSREEMTSAVENLKKD